MRKSLVLLLIIMLVSSEHCFGLWVWSPKTGKWVNPNYQSFDTPEEYFTWAKQFFDNGKFTRALSEFRRIVKKYPKTAVAPEAKYYAAFCLEKLGKYYRAFKMYQEVLDQYPLNERLDQIIEQQYLLGEIYFKKKKYELAREIFEKSLMNSPFSKVADVVQYKVGMASFKLREFNEARDAFDKIAETYSYSPHLDNASFYSALCSFKISSISNDYDMGLLQRAIDDLQYFLRRFPTSGLVPNAESLLHKLVYAKAEKLFTIAQFYEKQNKEYAAILYYEQVALDFEQTNWGSRARIKLQTLRQ